MRANPIRHSPPFPHRFDATVERLCYAPDLKFYRVWSKEGRVEYPVLEVD